jgi:hypothetical protein
MCLKPTRFARGFEIDAELIATGGSLPAAQLGSGPPRGMAAALRG